jgi:hypothetical protein
LESTLIWPASPEILAQSFCLLQDEPRVLQEGAAGLRGRHTLAAANEQRRAERLLHVADSGRGGGKREMGTVGPAGDASRFHYMAEQPQIAQVEAHGLLSLFAKEYYANFLLSAT